MILHYTRSHNVGLRSEVSAPGMEPVRWCPPNHDLYVLCNPYEGDYITTNDWSLMGGRLARSQRPAAVKEILANANAMLDEGHLRSAVIEAVIALELALNRFAEAPDVTKLRDDRVFATNNLASRVKHLGFSTSVEHLLPLVFPELFLTAGQLSECRRAIACRQTIAHSGQRNLDEAEARAHVVAIRSLSLKLLSAKLVKSD